MSNSKRVLLEEKRGQKGCYQERSSPLFTPPHFLPIPSFYPSSLYPILSLPFPLATSPLSIPIFSLYPSTLYLFTIFPLSFTSFYPPLSLFLLSLPLLSLSFLSLYSLSLPHPYLYSSLLSIPSTSPNQFTLFTKSKKRTGVLQKRTGGGAGRIDKERK
jgi:hypothetical protein